MQAKRAIFAIVIGAAVIALGAWGYVAIRHPELLSLHSPGGKGAAAERAPRNRVVTPEGLVITGDEGSTIRYTTDVTTSEDGGEQKHEVAGTGEGASFTGSSEAGTKFDASAPKSHAGGAWSDGGDTTVSWSPGDKGGVILLVAGILFCAVGAFLIYRAKPTPATICFKLGAVFIIASFVPQWAWAIISLGAVAIVVLYLYREHKLDGIIKAGEAAVDDAEGKATQFKEAARAMVAGVENLPDATRKAAKAEIQKTAERTDTIDDFATIRQIKAEDGLPSERPGV